MVALDPKVREIWQGPTGGLIRETSAPPQFLSALDREHWIAAGRPQVSAPSSTQELPPARALDLPTNPDALYAKLHDEAVGNANGTEMEMLTEVGDALRETAASPALRASLYEVAARIPGIELLGPTTDRLGRRGVAVAYSSSDAHERHELIFDPRTSALLGEEYESLDGNVFGYPGGTVTGYATYISTGVVDGRGTRPSHDRVRTTELGRTGMEITPRRLRRLGDRRRRVRLGLGRPGRRRVDRRDPPRARARRQLDRHRRAVRLRPLRGGRRPRARRASTSGRSSSPRAASPKARTGRRCRA